ncbi:MAG TPA: SNF2-related protein, partial [Candidatus Binatia bacterium]|nr:SNF2-related protein [Candidatus Binatia bacterium]
PFQYIEDNLLEMAREDQARSVSQGGAASARELEEAELGEVASFQRRLWRKEQKQIEEEAHLRERMAQMAQRRRQRQQLVAARRRAVEAARPKTASGSGRNTISPTPLERAPIPDVDVRLVFPAFEFQDTAFRLPDGKAYALQERAALWWVSNQSDDLLCLPRCRITRLDYQVRAALRVLGPLRGRALLSDEVGLGKTIEAGLVIKELLTRGMVKRFLVLTVPSLVDQWEEELAEKFGLVTATTNHASARAEGGTFWLDNPAIVASLHTLKQPAQRQVAAQVHWDILVVDEAHYLRNRESQAWKAVNALPRQFLLLLTATPVQNSLEELYNLVTLLQPGQLPTPKEFRGRFFDPKRPRQPLEPEELRRLLGQVMIRNTRANCGIELPPRRAETVLFSPDEAERVFWQGWEKELREQLARLNAAQASLWGRLLLQSAGSSPAAWRSSLEKFPDSAASSTWRQQAPLEASWARKCELIPPLTRGDGGVVIFSQFLETQAALASFLQSHGVATFWINGSTPASDRQPITEEFRKQGGALLLTHSGTEGRNLQFCHRLVNFDLPWNPMEIEQRIGRLHRLGQKHPVRIYNFVQAGTLQEHLLDILQEKLNLFELVVGETGLVLGDRFGSDEFAEEIL